MRGLKKNVAKPRSLRATNWGRGKGKSNGRKCYLMRPRKLHFQPKDLGIRPQYLDICGVCNTQQEDYPFPLLRSIKTPGILCGWNSSINTDVVMIIIKMMEDRLDNNSDAKSKLVNDDTFLFYFKHCCLCPLTCPARLVDKWCAGNFFCEFSGQILAPLQLFTTQVKT